MYKEKGSKFYSYAYPISHIDQVQPHLMSLKEQHPKSRHICYAYRLKIDGSIFRYNDDGEPSNTAGRPIFNSILSNEISDALICVVRYFGGTKLGATGLIRAYRSAADVCLDKNTKRRVYLTNKIKVTYPIEKMGKIYKVIKDQGIETIENYFEPCPHMIFECRLSLINQTIKNILGSVHGYAPEELSDDFESEIIKMDIIS